MLSIAGFRPSSSRHTETKKCGCRRCEQAPWSAWQNRSTTKSCSRAFEQLWRVDPDTEVCTRAQGGLLWELLRDLGTVTRTRTVVHADSSKSSVTVLRWKRCWNRWNELRLPIPPCLSREKPAPARS